MIENLASVAATSFTRQLDGVAASGSSSLTAMPGNSADGIAPDFGATMASVAGDMVSNLRGAEQASFAGIAGEADTRQVVDAVMSAEQTLQTAIAIRDKIVSAYLEISRMQI